jgi:hypothetical protein
MPVAYPCLTFRNAKIINLLILNNSAIIPFLEQSGSPRKSYQHAPSKPHFI